MKVRGPLEDLGGSQRASWGLLGSLGGPPGEVLRVCWGLLGAKSLHRVNESEPSEQNPCTGCIDCDMGILMLQSGFLDSGNEKNRWTVLHSGAARLESLQPVHRFAPASEMRKIVGLFVISRQKCSRT